MKLKILNHRDPRGASPLGAAIARRHNAIGSEAARRDFLGRTATGALLAVAALAVGAPEKAWAKPESKNERKRLRYKETDHVRRYYESNRY